MDLLEGMCAHNRELGHSWGTQMHVDMRVNICAHMRKDMCGHACGQLAAPRACLGRNHTPPIHIHSVGKTCPPPFRRISAGPCMKLASIKVAATSCLNCGCYRGMPLYGISPHMCIDTCTGMCLQGHVRPTRNKYLLLKERLLTYVVYPADIWTCA